MAARDGQVIERAVAQRRVTPENQPDIGMRQFGLAEHEAEATAPRALKDPSALQACLRPLIGCAHAHSFRVSLRTDSRMLSISSPLCSRKSPPPVWAMRS